MIQSACAFLIRSERSVMEERRREERLTKKFNNKLLNNYLSSVSVTRAVSSREIEFNKVIDDNRRVVLRNAHFQCWAKSSRVHFVHVRVQPSNVKGSCIIISLYRTGDCTDLSGSAEASTRDASFSNGYSRRNEKPRKLQTSTSVNPRRVITRSGPRGTGSWHVLS